MDVSTSLRIVEVPREERAIIRELNRRIFGDTHVIRSFERTDLLMLVAWLNGAPTGFKVGYRLRKGVFYSAKGGVVPDVRRQGVARALLHAMLDAVRGRGYREFVFDTFPNKHPGMTILALNEGFQVVKAGYNAEHEDYRLRFSRSFPK
ncbi:MAG: GNAT family N-acetyltransferase [Longimonas sp.]|uniref:GNAT family N-acetyltransferase n=1 Tax=Longimonas sp. TaxID=2039626 RepID=UPI003356018C